MLRKCLSYVVVLCFLFMVSGCVVIDVNSNGSVEYKEYGEEIFPAFEYLNLDNSNGRVVIEPSQDGKIKVQYVKILRGSSEARLKEVAPEVVISFEKNDPTLNIKTILPRVRPVGVSSWGAEYRLYLPVEIIANIDTSNGLIQASGMQNNIDLHSSNGPVTVRDHVGDISIDTSNGMITVERAEGMIEVDTSNGPIMIVDVEGAIDADTSNGRITIQSTRVIDWVEAESSNGPIEFKVAMNPKGRYNLSTSNGSIKFWMSKKYGYDMYSNTSNGRINFEFPITFSGIKENTRVVGQLFGGGINLNLKTTNANITIYEMEE